jgi:transposase-like protein
MIFVPFTGVNHHMQSVFFGGAFIVNEKIEPYEWLFRTFLLAMGGKAPRLIITDKDASMKLAIRFIFPDTVHRFCIWHIMEKMLEKVGSPTNKDKQFWANLNECVRGSETQEEFEMRCNAVITNHGLQGNEWLANRYHIRKSWIPVYFMDIPLAGVLRTISRSESSNSFFNRFIHRKLSFVEFLLRFDAAL